MSQDDTDNVQDDTQDQDPSDVADAARDHLDSTDPADTEAHVAQRVQGMAPSQQNDLAATLLSQAQQHGVDVNGLCAQFGIDPNQAGGYLSQIMGFLHENHPEALSQAAGQSPDIAGLLAHPSVGGVLGALASRFFSR
jgi:hypothetical protein